jgi:hypothetical protein
MESAQWKKLENQQMCYLIFLSYQNRFRFFLVVFGAANYGE